MASRRCGILSAMTGPLTDATKAFRRAEAVLDRRRSELARAVVEATAAGVRQSEIVRITGYTREHIRRIVRDHNDVAGAPF